MSHCRHYLPRPISRREMLMQASNGFGAVALSALLADGTLGATKVAGEKRGLLAPQEPHFEAKAKSVIFLYMDGGPSQVDTFDPKPALDKYHGRNPREVLSRVEPTQFNNIGKVLKSPWKFKK